MSETPDYVRLVVDSLQLTSTAYEQDYAVPKSYVDGVKSDIMGGLTTEALDTIKELAEYMADGTVAGGLVGQLSNLSAYISDETGRATAIEADLYTRISGVETRAEDAVSAERTRAMDAEGLLSTAISDEYKSRVDAVAQEAKDRDSAISAAVSAESLIRIAAELDLDGKITAEQQRAEGVEAGKANLSGGAMFEGGDLVVLDSYLQFGTNWRVRGSGDGKRLVFEHKREGGPWRTALPFITSA